MKGLANVTADKFAEGWRGKGSKGPLKNMVQILQKLKPAKQVAPEPEPAKAAPEPAPVVAAAGGEAGGAQPEPGQQQKKKKKKKQQQKKKQARPSGPVWKLLLLHPKYQSLESLPEPERLLIEEQLGKRLGPKAHRALGEGVGRG